MPFTFYFFNPIIGPPFGESLAWFKGSVSVQMYHSSANSTSWTTSACCYIPTFHTFPWYIRRVTDYVCWPVSLVITSNLIPLMLTPYIIIPSTHVLILFSWNLLKLLYFYWQRTKYLTIANQLAFVSLSVTYRWKKWRYKCRDKW
jgi:hypothetical protein